MTQHEINRMWKNQMQEGNYDYWTAQENWAWFIDALCKDGVITDRQYNNIQFPYSYGKPVRITR